MDAPSKPDPSCPSCAALSARLDGLEVLIREQASVIAEQAVVIAKQGEEIERLKRMGSGFGFASCDSCHTRHTFSVKEAREPEACATCHMGFDHPQWEMYSTSKHGVR